MASQLPVPGADCCVPVCDDEVLVQVPGPAGVDGTDGSDGADGDNAYSPLLAGFTMPAEGATVVANVDSEWMAIGQKVFVQFAGTMEVSAKTDATHATLKNVEDTATGLYTENAPPGTAIPIGVQISPSGLQGPIGTVPANILDDASPTMNKGDLLADDGANSPNASLQREPVGANGTTLHADSTTANGLAYSRIDLADATEVTGVLPIVNGGTGQATQTNAFNAVSPLTTRGDLLTRDATNNVRLGVGASGTILRSNGTDPAWVPVSTVIAASLFTSAPVALINAFTAQNFAHGFGATPQFVQAVIVNAVSEFGYAIGDEVDVALCQGTGDNTFCMIERDQINVTVIYNGSPLQVRRKDTGALANITFASWNLKAYALKL